MGVLDLVEEGDGEGSCEAGDVTAEHEDDAELAECVGEGEYGGGEEGGFGERKDDAPEDGEWGCSEDGGGGGECGVYGLEGGDEGLDGEGQAVEHGAEDEAGEGEGEWVSEQGDDGAAECGGGAEADEEIEAEDRWRKDEWEGDGGLQEASGKGVAGGDEGGERCCEQEQEDRGERGEAEREEKCWDVHAERECSGFEWDL